MVTIPPVYLKDNGLRVGQIVELQISGDALTIKPAAKKRVTLAEIIEGSPKKAARLRAEGWDDLPPAGREL